MTGLRFSVYRDTGPLLLCDLVEPLDPVQKTLDTHLLGSGYATPCSKRWVSQICYVADVRITKNELWKHERLTLAITGGESEA